MVNVGKYTIHTWMVCDIYFWNFQMPIYQVTRLVFLHPNIWNEGLVYDLGANFKTKKSKLQFPWMVPDAPFWHFLLLLQIPFILRKDVNTRFPNNSTTPSSMC